MKLIFIIDLYSWENVNLIFEELPVDNFNVKKVNMENIICNLTFFIILYFFTGNFTQFYIKNKY